MASRYDGELPHRQLRRLEAERAHLDRLGDILRQWTAAAQIVNDTRNKLASYTENLRANAWFDAAADDFTARVGKSVEVLDTWRDAFDENLHRLQSLTHTLSFDFPDIYRNVCKERDDYEREVYAKGQADPRPYQERAGAQTARLDSYYYAITWTLLCLASGSPWNGPRAALPGPGSALPGSPTGSPAGGPTSAGAGTPEAAEAPDPGTVPEPGTPETPGTPAAPGTPEATDGLAAAAKALQAAQGLLGGGGVPPAIPVNPGGFDLPGALPVDGRPALAGLDAGAAASFGGQAGGAATFGGGAGSAAMTGPGTATPPGVGAAPVPVNGLAGGTAGGTAGAAGARGTPPMYPPQSGAGAAAGARQASGIKPGDRDRPAGESGPRPRRGASAGPVTPGVALAGRAGATTPKPAARRGWDSDNDSLRVLDEHLWQVNSPEEEEDHGQDRRRSGRDGHDRTAAHRAPDAGLVGPGGRTDQPTRAR